MPVWIYHIPEGEFYGIPIVQGAPGIKVGSHRQGPTLVSAGLFFFPFPQATPFD